MKERIRQIFPQFISGVLHSYTQVFFSNNRVFAIILMGVSFFDWVAGVSGLLAVLISNGVAYLMGFNRFNIKSGYYGFNSLLVGLGLGIYYSLSPQFLLVLLFASIFTLFFTVMLEGVIGKYGLPYLSISFLLGIWMVTLASRNFTALDISERGIYWSNEMYKFGGGFFVDIYNQINNLKLPKPLIIYFNSLGAIFFQYHLIAGVVITIGLLIYSRLAFLLSITGFLAAYFFYLIVGGNIAELSYTYIGFNFILTSIAIGGYFIVPSKYSFLWVILLVPLISITIISSSAVLQLFQLSIYSLPFNFVVLLFLYILKFRERYYHMPEIVVYQQFSPEKNLYSQINNKERFLNFKYADILLPFWGEWIVTQGHHGEFTHKEEWAHAWDFEIADEQGSTFRDKGLICADYYCYNKPVIAPADGTVEEITDYIDDNEIGDVNLENNWGNTLVLKHREKLYTNLSHLKKGTFRVKKGDKVKRGDILAYCGNSGRSPQPHIHFQIQETPFIGSKTLDHPIGHYIRHEGKQFEFESFGKPAKGDLILNIEKNTTLYRAFHFITGQILKFEVTGENGSKKQVTWQVETDIYNNSYLHDKQTKSFAWFKNEGNIHYFTNFVGNRKSLLFYFYLAAYKIPAGFYKDMEVTDSYPIHLLNRKGLIFLQDFIAPFYIFIRSDYRMKFISIKDYLSDSKIGFISSATVKQAGHVSRSLNFELEIESDKIKKFIIKEKKVVIEAKELSTD